MARIKIICARCGSENVTRDGLLRWCVATQQWEASSELDNADCDDCSQEVDLEEIEIPDAELGTAAPKPSPEAIQDALLHALRSMVAATSGENKEKFPGHNKAYLEMVAMPRALKAIELAAVNEPPAVVPTAPGCDPSDPMVQEVWITIRLKGEMKAAEDANAVAGHVLNKCEHLFVAAHPGLSFTVCQRGDVIEVEEEVHIYDNGEG